MPIRRKLSNYCLALLLAAGAGPGIAAQEKPDAPTPKQTAANETPQVRNLAEQRRPSRV
jgi:hypothetical protein